jgi:dTDP-4-amino-4,6-dideoxygalactose transaminase
MNVPFVDLGAQLAALEPELGETVRRVLAGGAFILGPELERFEEEFARYCGVDCCVGVASGLDALVLSLEACGVGPGDEVITAANTFIATVFAVERTGATPVLVDCDPDTRCLDAGAAEAAITARTRVLLPVHLYGRLAAPAEIAELARRHGLAMVEDAAQAHGAASAGRRAGSFGRAGCFSFYPAKNLGACGDGGAVVTGDAELAERLRRSRNYGQAEKNRHVALGVNSRLDSLQAAILRLKLRRLDAWNEARRRAAETYDRLLAEVPGVEAPPPTPERTAHVYHLYVVRVAARDLVRRELAERGVATGVHYPTPVHLQEACRRLGRGPGSFPAAERLSREALSLPMFPEITAEQQERVVAALRAAVEAAA